jgi:HEAT repeat protein
MSTSRSTRSGDRGRPLSALLTLVLAAALLAAGGCSRGLADRPLAEVIAAAEQGGGAALRELVDRFGDPDPAVAQAAWDAAVKIGPPVIPACIAALSSPQRSIGEHAAGALGALQAKEAVDPLTAALARSDFRRYVAAWALGEIADPRAIPALVRALGDADPETRKYATRALTKFGPGASDALIAALGDPAAPVRRYAVRALGQLQERRAVEPLLALEGKVDADVLLWALGRLGDRRGLPLLVRSAGAADWKLRLAAVQGLGDLADPAAVPALRTALGDPEWIVREWAARGLESLTGERVLYRDQHGNTVAPYSLYR